MDELINAHKFALAVVSANPQDGTLETIAQQSLALYKAAYIEAIKHNEPIHQKQHEQQKSNTDAFLDAFS